MRKSPETSCDTHKRSNTQTNTFIFFRRLCETYEIFYHDDFFIHVCFTLFNQAINMRNKMRLILREFIF